MQDPTLKKLLSSLNESWNSFENILFLPTHLEEFQSFLNKYCGLPLADKEHSQHRDLLSKKFISEIGQFFSSIFKDREIFKLHTEKIEHLLCQFEKNFNLLLYYWFGKNDRNYQFRTCIHFLNLNQISIPIFKENETEFSLFLTENGIEFSINGSRHLPYVLPSSQVYGLEEKLSEHELFARIRSVQREVCLLIDQWEYINSIFAMEFKSGVMHFEKRISLATFVLESFCDFQEWIVKLSTQAWNEDITSEKDALSSLLLSAVQKILLPASISRICYPLELIVLFERFTKTRIEHAPEDYSAKLMLQALQSAQGMDFSEHLFKILTQKPHEWKLSFDPSNAIKAFSWSYGQNHHALLCALLGICYFKKTLPKKLDDFHFIEIAHSLQTRETFSLQKQNHKVHQNPCSISADQTQMLFSTLTTHFKNDLKRSDSTKEYLDYIEQFLRGNFT